MGSSPSLLCITVNYGVCMHVCILKSSQVDQHLVMGLLCLNKILPTYLPTNYLYIIMYIIIYLALYNDLH